MERKYGIFEIIEILYCCEISWLPYSLEIKLSLLRAKKLNPEWLYKPSVEKQQTFCHSVKIHYSCHSLCEVKIYYPNTYMSVLGDKNPKGNEKKV